MHTVPRHTALAPPNWFKISENDPGPPRPASNAPPRPRPAPAPATGLLQSFPPSWTLQQTANKLSAIISDIINPVDSGA